ncbi:hypothetical protein Tco_0022771, partial [Tanacetum coccineum]
VAQLLARRSRDTKLILLLVLSLIVEGSLLSWAQKPRTSISILATVPPCLHDSKSESVILRGSAGFTISDFVLDILYAYNS